MSTVEWAHVVLPLGALVAGVYLSWKYQATIDRWVGGRVRNILASVATIADRLASHTSGGPLDSIVWSQAAGNVMSIALQFRPASAEDEGGLQAIRQQAFAPVFAAFRTMLGDEIYDLAQRGEDEAQGQLLSSLIVGQPGWTLYVAHLGGVAVGFIAIHVNATTGVGEIGLNAVEPARSGAGSVPPCTSSHLCS
jgi:hypothetical protein